MIPRFAPRLGVAELWAAGFPARDAVQSFERGVAKKFHALDAVAFPYGRAAQWAFFKAVGIEGVDIHMPAYTCSVVAHSISLSGNNPRFIDIKLDDYNMDLGQLADSMTERTRAIIATNTFGYPQDVVTLQEIVRDAEKRYGHKVWLMQDCCHSFGARWGDRFVGEIGDVAVYAFNVSKHLTSIFGGVLTFGDQELADQLRSWRDAHFSKPTFAKAIRRLVYLVAIYCAFNRSVYGATWYLSERTSLLDRYTKSFHLDDKIHFPADYLEQMSPGEAAVGIEQLTRYDQILEDRRTNAEFWERSLRGRKEWALAPIREGATYSHYVARVPDRRETVDEFGRLGLHLGELIQYSIPDIKSYAALEQECPNSRKASRHTVNFPVTESPARLSKWLSRVGNLS